MCFLYFIEYPSSKQSGSPSTPNGTTSIVAAEGQRLQRIRSRPDSLDLSPNASQKRKAAAAAAAALNEEARYLRYNSFIRL